MKLFSTLMLLAVLPASAVLAAPVKLQGHLGVYELSLSATRDGAGFSAVNGRLALEVKDSCESIAQNQRMLLRTETNDGRQMLSDNSHNTVETLNGLVIRFNTKNQLDGKVTEEFAGRAVLEALDKPGKVTFTQGDMEDMELEAGTVFPTQHFLQLIAAAQKGEKILNRKIYDGSGPEGLYDTVSVISKAKPSEDPPEQIKPLVGRDSWNIRIAYFAGEEASAGTPEYEIEFNLYDNGIATDLVLDYGTFVLKGKLSQLKLLPSSCS